MRRNAFHVPIYEQIRNPTNRINLVFNNLADESERKIIV
jgi:hypothetical protein